MQWHSEILIGNLRCTFAASITVAYKMNGNAYITGDRNWCCGICCLDEPFHKYLSIAYKAAMSLRDNMYVTHNKNLDGTIKERWPANVTRNNKKLKDVYFKM